MEEDKVFSELLDDYLPETNKYQDVYDAAEEYCNEMIQRTQNKCAELGLKCEYSYGNLYITTPYSSWYFTPTTGKIVLRHLSVKSNKHDDYHVQFKKKISPEEIVIYIYEHDLSQYTCWHKKYSVEI